MRILALDPGKSVGLALVIGGRLTHVDQFDISKIAEKLAALNVDIVVVEKLWKNPVLLERSGMLVYAAQTLLPTARIKRPAPTTWQRVAHEGAVDADPKQRSLRYVLRHCNMVGVDVEILRRNGRWLEDAIDAACMALVESR